MNLKIIITFISILPIVYGCSNDKQETGFEKYALISGKVNNYDRKSFVITFSKLLDPKKLTEIYRADIDENNEFAIKVPIHFTQEFTVLGTSLLCSPGDSINIIIGSQHENNMKQPAIIDLQGSKSKINQELLLFQANFPTDKEVGIEKNDLKKMSPYEYRTFIEQREEIYREYLKDFCNSNSTSLLFQKWANDKISYGSFNDL